MNKQKRGLVRRLAMALCILSLLASNILDVTLPMALAADGNVDATEFWVEWRRNSNEGYSGTKGTGWICEGAVVVGEMNITYQYEEIDVDALSLYYFRSYMYSDDNDDRVAYFAAYEYTAENDAGAYIGNSTQTISEAPAGSYEWRAWTLDDPIWINSTQGMVGDDWVFFFGINTATDDGVMYVSEGVVAGDGSGYQLRDTDGSLPPTFAEVSTKAYLNPIQTRFRGYKNDTTTTNEYWGNSTHYTARRDLNYTFPTGVDSRQIRILVPVNEFLVNISRSNGGLWDDTLDSDEFSRSSFNATHDIITLSNAVCSLYGGDFRLYTTSYPYVYIFNGRFYENGTWVDGCTVTAHLTNGSTLTLWVNTTDVMWTFNSSVELFTYPCSTETRRIYPRFSNEEFWLFETDGTPAYYGFEVRDYTGVSDSGAWLEYSKGVNGTEIMIERLIIAETYNDLSAYMTQGRTYHLEVFTTAGVEYDFGYFIAGAEDEPKIVLNDPPFDQRVQIAHSWITFQSWRSTDGTNITASYDDDLEDTISLNYTIYNVNGTSVYNDYSGGVQVKTWTYLLCDNETSYYVVLDVAHDFYVEGLHYEYFHLYTPDFNSSIFDFSELGTSTIDLTQIIPLIFIWGVGGMASYASSYIIGAIVVIMVPLFGLMGLLDVNYTAVGIAFGLVIAIAFSGRRRQ